MDTEKTMASTRLLSLLLLLLGAVVIVESFKKNVVEIFILKVSLFYTVQLIDANHNLHRCKLNHHQMESNNVVYE